MTLRRVHIGCLALCLAASPATAQPRPDESSVESPEIRELARQGAAEQAAGHHEAAIAAFAAAGERSHAPRYTALVGLNQAALDRWVEAFRSLREALQHRSDPWIARNEAVLDAEYSRVRGHVAWVRLTGTPAGARVSVNGSPVGRFPLADDVLVAADAPADVETSAEGYAADRRIVDLVGGQVVPARVNLMAVIARLRVHASPEGSTVRIDGGRALSSDEVIEVANGSHEVEVSAPGFTTALQRVDIAAAELVEVRVALVRAPEPSFLNGPSSPDGEAAPRPLATFVVSRPLRVRPGPQRTGEQTRASYTWVSLGAGVALTSLTATVILAVANNDEVRVYDAACRGPAVAPAGCVDTWRQSQSEIDDRTHVIIATSIGAVVGTAVATYFLLFPDRSPPPLTRARARLQFAAAGAGLRVTW